MYPTAEIIAELIQKAIEFDQGDTPHPAFSEGT